MDKDGVSMEGNNVISETNAEKPRRKIPRWALIADAALLIAAIVFTIFSRFWLASGERAELADGIDAAAGKVASFSVNRSYGHYAERYGALTNNVTGRYYLCVMGGGPVTILVPESGFEAADLMKTQTLQEIFRQRYGTIAGISGEGYVRPLTEGELDMAYAWFENNQFMFEDAGGAAPDAAEIIGAHVVVMGYVGSIPAKMSSALTNLAVVFLAFMFILPVLSLLPVDKAELAAAAGPAPEADEPEDGEGRENTDV